MAKREFDLTVHTRDKEGKIIAKNPYQYVCDQNKGNYFIRGGQKFHLDGTPMEEKVEAPKTSADKPKVLG